jgi:hypothetical protein
LQTLHWPWGVGRRLSGNYFLANSSLVPVTRICSKIVILTLTTSSEMTCAFHTEGVAGQYGASTRRRVRGCRRERRAETRVRLIAWGSPHRSGLTYRILVMKRVVAELRVLVRKVVTPTVVIALSQRKSITPVLVELPLCLRRVSTDSLQLSFEKSGLARGGLKAPDSRQDAIRAFKYLHSVGKV